MRNKGYYKIVRNVLAGNIRSGRIPAGTRLTTATVADRLVLSRPPVRRALEQLVQEGVLFSHPQRGYIVGPQCNDGGGDPINLHRLDLDLALLESGSTTPLAPRWETILKEVEESVKKAIPFGTFQISEAGICDHFGVSRTVAREVLARLNGQGLIEKSRSSHWIGGPLSARALDEVHQMRRLLEPQALADATPRLASRMLLDMRHTLETLRARGGCCTHEEISRLERLLHCDILAECRNRRMVATIFNLQIAHVVDELFRSHIGVHDETALLNEHALIVGHLLGRDGEGAAYALRGHLDAEHQRTRARLKVLSIIEPPRDLPYLIGIH